MILIEKLCHFHILLYELLRSLLIFIHAKYEDDKERKKKKERRKKREEEEEEEEDDHEETGQQPEDLKLVVEK